MSMSETKRNHDYFITGTDTEIGKTFVSSALLYALAQNGISSIGMKPIASGAEMRDGVWHNEDVDALMSASSVKSQQELVCPYLMQTPAAPHIVAEKENVSISLAHIQTCFQQLQTQGDAVIVEGVGGFCVPLSDDISTVDMAKEFNLPVILVVGLRLGCINHALLTAQAIAASGLQLVAWVANTVDDSMLYQVENIQALKLRLPVPCLGLIPRLPNSQSSKQAATYLDLNLLK
jgi:dethiobiotin synthetase